MAASSITILDTIYWAKRFIFLRNLASGNNNEPALTNANTILQTIVGAPFAWRWNRAVIGFVAVQGQQDYTIFNWQQTTAIGIGYVLVDTNGFSQQVTTAGVTGATIPTPFNITPGQTTTDGSVIWTNMGAIGVGNTSTIYNFDWIETASVQAYDANTCLPTWKEISVKMNLALDSAQSRPHDVSAQYEDANGNITFRLMPAPDKAYPVVLSIQQKPTTITSLNQTWGPIPDEYSRLYNWGFLALSYLYADDARFTAANQKFIASLLSTSQGLTQSERNIWLNNWQAITGVPIENASRTQQGFQGRSNL
jgi:hypothetical protein